jgi:hypothetical protein
VSAEGIDYNPEGEISCFEYTLSTKGSDAYARRIREEDKEAARIEKLREHAAYEKQVQDRLFPPAKNPAGRGAKRTYQPRGSSAVAKRAALARSAPLSSREQQVLMDEVVAAETQAVYDQEAQHPMTQPHYSNRASEFNSLLSSSEDEGVDDIVDDDHIDINIRVAGGTHVPDPLVGDGTRVYGTKNSTYAAYDPDNFPAEQSGLRPPTFVTNAGTPSQLPIPTHLSRSTGSSGASVGGD